MTAHILSAYATASGWGWGCSCGKSGSGNSAPTPDAARGYGLRHVAREWKRATIEANARYYEEHRRKRDGDAS